MSGGLFEPSLVHTNGHGLIASRKANHQEHGVVWFRAENPFKKLTEPVSPPAPSPRNVPLTPYRCADGVVRLLTGDPRLASKRSCNPLRMWDIDPRDFSASNHRIIFEAANEGLSIREKAVPIVDQCKLLPHAGGRQQYLVHRVRTFALDVPKAPVLANEQEKLCSGIYYEKISYAEPCLPQWTFE